MRPLTVSVQVTKQQSGDLAAFGFQLKKLKYIERFAEAVVHKCPGKSSLNVLSVLWYFFPKVIAKCLPKLPDFKISMIVFIRKLKVVHHQDGLCVKMMIR